MGNYYHAIDKNFKMQRTRAKDSRSILLSILVIALLIVSASPLLSTEMASAAFPSPRKTKLNITVPFPAPEIIEARGHHRVMMDGLESFGNPGEPLLPVRSVRVLIPYNSEVKEVRVLPGRKTILDGSYYIEPAQMPVHFSPQEPIEPFTEPTLPDKRIYNSSSPFPARIHSDPFIQSKMGYSILVLNLNPVGYIPTEGKLFYFEDMTVEVEIEQFVVEREGLLKKYSTKDRETMGRIVDNPETIDTYFQRPQEPMAEGISLTPLQYYQYVIITSEELENYSGAYNWQTLCSRKESRGITTNIVTLEWIYANYAGVDNAEKIRNFIKDAYDNWGAEYVLLGGDDTVVPFRKFWVMGEEMPSDMYYSCLDGTFNYDNDGLWGEPNDGENGGEVDLYAEVHVGRAPVASGADVSNFVRKTLAFEDFVPKDKYLAYMVGEHLGFGGVSEYAKDMMEEIRLGSGDHGYTTKGFISCDTIEANTLYEKDQSWSKYDLIDIVNNGVRVLNHLGHGNNQYAMKLYNSDLDSFTNTEYFFAYSQTCLAGHFDDTECWAEKVTRMDNGAAAVVMNARYGWGMRFSTDGPSQHFNREFWDAVFSENISSFGAMNSDSKEDQDWYISSSSYGRWCAYGLNLFGDPELRLQTSPMVTVSPKENCALPGASLSYTVSVWNGVCADNYTLTSSDNKNWGLALSENSLETMQPCEVREVTLTVTISDNVIPGAEDNILVTLTSQENAEISDNVSCVARVPPSRRVEVSIAPSENYGRSGENITFEVEVKNTGIGNDNYYLTVEDNTGWPTVLSENLFENMAFDESCVATLTVMIPDNENLIDAVDNLIVTATSQENENISDNASCVARCVFLYPHEPIVISSDNEFTSANGVVGGSGVENDPYIIENWSISVEFYSGITIMDTAAHFIVRNCFVDGRERSWYTYGIYLRNVINGKAENCTSKNYDFGIYLSGSDNNITVKNVISGCYDGIAIWWGSSNNTVVNSILSNNYYGVDVFVSDNNWIENNTANWDTYAGILIDYSSGITVKNNAFGSCAIQIRGWEVSHYNTHTIDNNTVNGKPIYYYADVSGIVVPDDAGEVILANCSNMTVENVNASNSTLGIELACTNDSLVTNNIVENNKWGIFLIYSDNNTITNNVVDLNKYDYGIGLHYSDNNRIENNTTNWDTYNGIFLERSDNNIITNNTSSYNYYGVRLFDSGNNIIVNNSINSNNMYGIILHYSSNNNRIYHNNFVNNDAYDDNFNYWDDDYPSGGNYWSDYTGEDNYQGENQDLFGSDGIGDVPYFILGDNNRDRYPLMNPWPPTQQVEVSISPSYQSALPGDNLNYTVTVKNTSSVVDNYDLSVSDTEGWPLLLENNMLGNVLPGENKQTALTVIISDNAIGCTNDSIIVTATSKENGNVSAENSCIAQAGIVLDVEVSILPGENLAAPGENVTFIVTITNMGNFPDNYDLTVSENLDWCPALDDNVIENLSPGENGETTLMVTIPENAENCTRDKIIVNAVSQADNAVRDNASCIAHARALPPPPSPRLPTQPQLYSPSNGSEVSTKTPTIRWENAIYAENHRVLLDDDSDPDADPLYDHIVEGDNQWTTPTLTEDETYYWKVIAQNENGENHSVTWHFAVNAEGSPPPSPPSPPSPPPPDTTPPAVPSLTSPADGKNLSDNTPILDWSDVSDPSGVTYSLSIATDNGFTSIVLQKTDLAASSYEITLDEALTNGTYYWRVQAADGANNASDWSEVWTFTFTVVPPPASPTIRILRIMPEAPVSVEFENFSIIELKISVLGTVENVEVTVRELIDRPAEVAISAPGAIYRYLEIIKENIADNDISEVTITFRVEKSWIVAKNVNENKITLNRYAENGEWVYLSTTRIGEDNTYIYFSSISPGLSFFTITGGMLTPAAFELGDLVVSPTKVAIGEAVKISVIVINTGDLEGTREVILRVNGVVEAIENVAVAGRSAGPVVFTVTKDVEGTYDVEVGGLTGTFTAANPSSIKWSPAIGAIAAIAIIGTIMAIYTKKRS